MLKLLAVDDKCVKIEAKGHKIQVTKLVKIHYWSKSHIFQLDFGFMLLKILAYPRKESNGVVLKFGIFWLHTNVIFCQVSSKSYNNFVLIFF